MMLKATVTSLLFFCFAGSSYGQDFELTHNSEGILLTEGGKKVLFYQKQPKSQEGKYERAGYVHPLYGMDEGILTEDFPADHLHHRGIFWAWHQMLIAQEPIADSWVGQDFSWDVVKTSGKSKKRKAIIHAEVLWKPDIENWASSKSIMEEKTKITVYTSQDQLRTIDFDIKLKALVDHLSLGGSDDKKGYGGFSVRLKLPSDIAFLSGNGLVTPQETALKAGAWLDFMGSFTDGQISGVTVISHPKNLGHPQPWILRSSSSMQNVVYPGRTPVEMPRGNSWRLRYRLVIHGELSPNAIEELYKDYGPH